MEKSSEYLIRGPKQVLSHLKTIAAKKCLISAGFGNNNSFLTAILGFDEKNQTLIIDCGPKEYLNKALLSSSIVTFKTECDGIEISFEGRGLKKAGDISQPTLLMKLPNSLYWAQRRKYYRTRSPFSKNSFCTFIVQDPEDEHNIETHDFKLFDLSATGFSVLTDTLKIAKPLTIGDEFIDCQLVLDGAETLNISFIIRNLLALNPNKLKKYQRVGCEFINFKQNNESACLRYMQEIERELKKTQK